MRGTTQGRIRKTSRTLMMVSVMGGRNGGRRSPLDVLYTELSVWMIEQNITRVSFSHIFSLPEKGQEVHRGCPQLLWSLWHVPMELCNHFLGVSQVASRFPCVLLFWVALPMDQILQMLSLSAGIHDSFHFILFVPIFSHFHRARMYSRLPR